MGSADTGAREPREVLRDYILSVPLAATDDDGSKKHAALNALAALAAGVGVPPDEGEKVLSDSALRARLEEARYGLENLRGWWPDGKLEARNAWLKHIDRSVRGALDVLAGVGEARPAEPPEGLHGKYHGLRRTRDDSLVEGWYFVIREDDQAGEAALLAYADACESYAPELATDLRRHVRDEQLARGLYDAGWER